MSGAPATPIDAVIKRVLATYRGWRRDTPVEQMRDDWDRLFSSPGLDAQLMPTDAGDVPGLWVAAPGTRADRALLYFHGGGFRVGSTRSHAELMAHISKAANCRVLGIDYRLAPEHRYPAPLEDALAAWAWLLMQGFGPGQLALGGDSAGAALALALLLSLQRKGQAGPAAAVLMSAWTDLSAGGESFTSRAAADPIHQRSMILATARNALGPDGDARNPLISPLFAEPAELAGLPPLLMQVGDRETVLSDSVDFAAKARSAGATVDLQVWDEMIHVFQQFPRELPQAREAIAALGTFLDAHWR